jgi:hypothetical protein
MPINVVCPACGDHGTLLVDDSSAVPHCPVCGQPFAIVSLDAEACPAADDEILEWVAQAGATREPEPTTDPLCQSCGYTGPMELDRAGLRMFCPACLSVCERRVAILVGQSICPHCGGTFELYEHDRGRSVLCSHCKYFLGCLLPVERPEYRLFGGRRARNTSSSPSGSSRPR